MITILDALLPPDKGKHLHLVLSRMPEFTFDRQADTLTADDYPFYYCLVKADVRKKAPLYLRSIQLTDGSVIVPNDWWPQRHPGAELVHVAISTPEQLKAGYYFYPGWIAKTYIMAYLSLDCANPDYYSWK